MAVEQVMNITGIIEFSLGFIIFFLFALKPNFLFKNMKPDNFVGGKWFRIISAIIAIFFLIKLYLAIF
jgi:hypothetical protein